MAISPDRLNSIHKQIKDRILKNQTAAENATQTPFSKLPKPKYNANFSNTSNVMKKSATGFGLAAAQSGNSARFDKQKTTMPTMSKPAASTIVTPAEQSTPTINKPASISNPVTNVNRSTIASATPAATVQSPVAKSPMRYAIDTAPVAAYQPNFTPSTSSSSSTSSTVQHKDRHLIRRARRAYDKSIKRSESMTKSALRHKRGKAWFRAANEVATNAKNRYHEAIGVGTYTPESHGSKTSNSVGASGLSAKGAGDLNNQATRNANDKAYQERETTNRAIRNANDKTYQERVIKNQADANNIQKDNYQKKRYETNRKNMAEQTLKEWNADPQGKTYSEYHSARTGDYTDFDSTGVKDETLFDLASNGKIDKSQMSHDQLRRWRASLKGGGE